MKAIKEKQSSKIQHLVANNPQADQDLQRGGNWDAKVIEREKKRTLYDSARASLHRFLETYRNTQNSYRTAAGHWKQRDEPDSEEQLRQSDAIQSKLKAQRAAAGRNRLKSKGAVPTRQGKKLFDAFIKEATAYRHSKQQSQRKSQDLENLQQIYLAARGLDSFEYWLSYLTDVLE